MTGRRGQPEPEGGSHGPREASSTKVQAGFVANQDFLGFWTVNIRLRRCAGCTPSKPSGRTGEALSRSNHTRQIPGHLSCLDLGRAQNAGPTKSAPLRTTQVPELERLRPGRCMQSRPGLGRFRQSNLEPEQCGQGGHMRCEQGQAQCGRDTASTRQCYLFAASLPPHSTTEK